MKKSTNSIKNRREVLKKFSFLIKITLLSGIVLVALSLFFQKMWGTDPSLEAPFFKSASLQNPEALSSVYLISYADGPEVFFKNQNTLAYSALNKGIDFILNYRRAHLDLGFIQENASILNQKKGAGYWLWKPWLILKTLKSIPENDIVIYTDTGLLFHQPIQSLTALTQQNDIILFEYDPKEYWGKPIHITKREIFLALNCDTPQCHEGRHVWAGMMILKNTPKSRAFIQQWLSYCQKKGLITDELDPNIVQHPNFILPYHDEAILNALYNQNPSGKYLYPSRSLFQHYANWHHRHPQQEHHSLLPALSHAPGTRLYFFQNDFINNPLSVLWREGWAALKKALGHER